MASFILTSFVLLLGIVNAEESDNCGYDGRKFFKAMGWCGHAGAKILLGDFNGDRQTDFLCHDTAGKNWVSLAKPDGTFEKTTWHDGGKWCSKSNTLFTGDFNGDGVTDFLCHSPTGQKWVKYFNRNGVPSGKHFYKAMGWCKHKGSKLYIGDFNGDKRDDLLCHDSRGRYWIAFASSDELKVFSSTSWYKHLGWCTHATSQLLLGDFNGDKKTDVLCTDKKGYIWIMYAKLGANVFTGTDWHRNLHWCLINKYVNVRIADVNGDEKDDLICHTQSGKNWIAYTQPGGGFGPAHLGGYRHMYYYLPSWCTGSMDGYHFGYFDKDHRADMLCHNLRDGRKWIRYGECPFAKRK